MTHPVHRPSHYTSHPSGIECIQITRHMNFNLGNAVKYLWRNGLKDGQPAIQDLQKAIWYIQDEIERMERTTVQQRINDIGYDIDNYLADESDESKADKMLFLDTETTGLDYAAQIIQLAIVDEDGNTIVNTLLDADSPISPEAYQVHRISKEHIKGYPHFRHIAGMVYNLLSGRQVGMYNAEFDMRMLRQSSGLRFNGTIPVCVMQKAKEHFGEEEWLSLVDACKRLDIELDNAHDALADAWATAKVYGRIVG